MKKRLLTLLTAAMLCGVVSGQDLCKVRRDGGRALTAYLGGGDLYGGEALQRLRYDGGRTAAP